MMITRYDWNETARCLARQVGSGQFVSGWGVVRLRLVDDSTTPPRFLDDGPLVVAVFGSDNFYTEPRARAVVQQVRRRLPDAGATEMGFAVHTHGASWVLLAGTDASRYRTVMGKTLQKLLLEAFLDDVIWSAWRSVYGEAGAAEQFLQTAGKDQSSGCSS
jgi:hypothetical protein